MPRKTTAPAVPAIVSAASRTLAILEALSASSSLGLEDLARATGFAKPTLSRFLATLQELGYIRRDEQDRWAITLKLFRVGSRALDHIDMHEAARPIARALAEELGETVHLGVLEGDEAVYVMKIESKYTIRMHSRVGRRVPLYCSALGKALLAFAPVAERKEILGRLKLVPFTERTIHERKALEAELDRVQARGFAEDDGENEAGIHCAGAPVFDAEGAVVAALSASWPEFRWTEADREARLGAVMAAAARISAILGHGPAR